MARQRLCGHGTSHVCALHRREHRSRCHRELDHFAPPLPVADANSILIMSNDYPNAGITGGNNSASGDYYDRLRGMTVFESQAPFHGRNQEEWGCPERLPLSAT